MKTLWICGLVLVFGTMVLARAMGTHKGEFGTLAISYGKPVSHLTATALNPPAASLNAGAVAPDRAVSLADYVHLHQTRVESYPAQVAAAAAK